MAKTLDVTFGVGTIRRSGGTSRLFGYSEAGLGMGYGGDGGANELGTNVLDSVAGTLHSPTQDNKIKAFATRVLRDGALFASGTTIFHVFNWVIVDNQWAIDNGYPSKLITDSSGFDTAAASTGSPNNPLHFYIRNDADTEDVGSQMTFYPISG